jgi:tetratricopeptide (TPR) repeat protein
MVKRGGKDEVPPVAIEKPLQTQIQDAKNLAESQPTDINYVNLGLLYVNNNQHNEAVDANLKAIQLNPNNAVAHNNLGYTFNLMGKWKEAISEFEISLALQPDFELAKNNMAWAKEELAKKNQALDDLKNKANQDPTFENYFALGLELYNRGDFNGSIEVNQKALKLNPNSALAYNNLCAAYNSIGKWNEAEAACKKAIELDPNFQLAKNNLQNAIDMRKKTNQ